MNGLECYFKGILCEIQDRRCENIVNRHHVLLIVLLLYGCVFTATIVSLNIPGGVLFTDFVKRLKNDRGFHELN